MQSPNKSFLNLHEVGAVIDRSSRTVLRLIHDHQLKAHQLRGRWVVTPENLDRFLKKLPSNF
ncbi:helix-turn-helix domain-containing protein [Prosthecobacter algae]|uniref:helix-turn-helix domain-containing protein n=1 Tax=Prosthecobacter algae TaxID=1144682 RepID=UPI0031E99CB5